MSKEHDGQAHSHMVTSAPAAGRRSYTPTYYQYSVPLFQPNASEGFWPDGGWARIQCWGLALVIVLEWSFIIKAVFFRH